MQFSGRKHNFSGANTYADFQCSDGLFVAISHKKYHVSKNYPFLQARPFDEPEVYEKGEEFTLANGYVRATFSADGFLQEVETVDDKVKTPVRLEMISYGTARTGDKSGAYLFMPNGPAEVLKPVKPPIVRVVEGKILSYVEVFTPWMRHQVSDVS